MPKNCSVAYRFSALSRAVVGGTIGLRLVGVGDAGFSALSRAVVGGTWSIWGVLMILRCFSALSRAVVGGTASTLCTGGETGQFQCSQSSRGWWNQPTTR